MYIASLRKNIYLFLFVSKMGNAYIIHAASALKGSPLVPGDKSISHRALIFAALAHGTTRISNLLQSEDVLSTLRCLQELGVQIEYTCPSGLLHCHSALDAESMDPGSEAGVTTIPEVVVHGVGLHGLKAPTKPLDCGNSGTTMRLLMGLLSAQPFESVLTGDASLQQRPMRRVADPLRKMGATIELTRDNFAPITLRPSQLHAANHVLEIASAQVKSALLLAGLFCPQITSLSGLIQSRDHSERMLQLFGASISGDAHEIRISGAKDLTSCSVNVPGDPSTAAFWMAVACLVPDSHIELNNISLNPTRTGFLTALQKMGAHIEIEPLQSTGEPTGNLTIQPSKLKGILIEPQEIPSLIDEIPILAIVCSQAHGVSEIRGASELRVKESDRLMAIATNLQNMGIEIELFPDGFRLQGPQRLLGAKIDSHKDHRIAMAFSVAGLLAVGETVISDPECVSISYPNFFKDLKELSA